MFQGEGFWNTTEGCTTGACTAYSERVLGSRVCGAQCQRQAVLGTRAGAPWRYRGKRGRKRLDPGRGTRGKSQADRLANDRRAIRATSGWGGLGQVQLSGGDGGVGCGGGALQCYWYTSRPRVQTAGAGSQDSGGL